MKTRARVCECAAMLTGVTEPTCGMPFFSCLLCRREMGGRLVRSGMAPQDNGSAGGAVQAEDVPEKRKIGLKRVTVGDPVVRGVPRCTTPTSPCANTARRASASRLESV